MKKISSLIGQFPIILASVLLFLGTAICWIIFLRFKITAIYYLLNLTYLVCVLLLIIGAVKYQHEKFKTAILLSLASTLLVLAMGDFSLLTFCYDTSGPGGVNVISHCHWFNKCVTKNEYGFWERSLAKFEKPSANNNNLVIAVVGDSFTWGQGVSGNSSRFTELLENKLNAGGDGPKITVLNFGKGGADTIQETEILNDYVAKVHPNLVLLGYLANDIFSDSTDFSDFSETLSTITPSVNFIYWRLIGPAKYEKIGVNYMHTLVSQYQNKTAFKKHMNDLAIYFQDVRKIGAQPVFVLLPFPHLWKLFPEETCADIYSRILQAVSEDGVPIIDLSYMEKKYSLEDFQVNPSDGHPNERMHGEFAESIYRWLMSHDNLLKKTGPQ